MSAETPTSEQSTSVAPNLADAGPTESPPDGNESSRPGRRRHGKGFIYLSLRDADDALRKIDHHAKRMSKDGFARALGHKKAEGRFYQKTDALCTYRLVEIAGDDVLLTPLAIDMLYGASEAARAKARTTAFLACEEFSKTFAECPKGQDHPVEYILDYVRGKLGIVNEVDRFKRLFLDSAHFAGLLEGEADPTAKSIRFRHATSQPTVGDAAPDAPTDRKDDPGFEVVGGSHATDILTSLGLSDFAGRADVVQKLSGKVTQQYADGQLTLEVSRPIRIVIKHIDLLIDLPAIVTAMRQKGLAI